MSKYLLSFLCYRIVDEFTKSSEHIPDVGLDFTSNSEHPDALQTDNNLKPLNQGSDSPKSSSEMIDKSPSTISNASCSEVPAPQQLPTNFNSCAVFNNYLFHQDPRTGHLSLLPVQVRAPESLLGLDINLSLVQQHFQGLIPVPDNARGSHMNGLNVPVRPKPQDYVPPSSFIAGTSVTLDSHSEFTAPRHYTTQSIPPSQTGNKPPSEPVSPKVHPALKEVIDLLKGEFSLQGYLEKGCEDIAMGM